MSRKPAFGSVSEGNMNKVKQHYASSISGGDTNFTETAEIIGSLGKYAWVGGGYDNASAGEWTSIFGGKDETALASYGTAP
jgi:hypothetical protein